ncbi:helix-turn-helix domain-containing protein [Candidatus Njordibacter sp. Uisw_039]|jgi:transcriptional regulator with XRE-family HTH domain|uniref:helix-turn-helix domain-containing protein n=1 Tax=Candidatus Njordibacter sp. Uisw_039 TaxID=3230972 RepID=UPI003A25A9E2|tara:strand:+ start:403 stop:990 length:588 start_codon:yes stop_codon:yes gene_type:complete
MSVLQSSNNLDAALGSALRDIRKSHNLTARALSQKSGVSAAMISRLERGHASASMATLNALSQALNVPLVSLFREIATEHSDYTHVKSGEGLVSTRLVGDHSHRYVSLALHTRSELQFEARSVTLVRQDSHPPQYVSHGVVFVYALQGQAIYQYGQRDFVLNPGDSISVDAELSHGFTEVITDTFTFLTVQAERR